MERVNHRVVRAIVLAGFSLSLAALRSQSMAGGGASALVWPAAGEYVGSRQCGLCHAGQARTYHSSSMSRALEPVDNCDVLSRNPRLTWSDGPYRYAIEKAGGGFRYSVSDGVDTAGVTLLYAFGQGKAGQTYVYEQDGAFFESRVSYYQELKRLDLTVGAQNSRPVNISQALGRRMTPGDARDCFGCHTTAARRGNELNLAKFENYVQCEDYHRPRRAHIA